MYSIKTVLPRNDRYSDVEYIFKRSQKKISNSDTIMLLHKVVIKCSTK